MGVIFTAAVAPMLWGTTYAVTTELLAGFDPFVVASARALPAGVFLTLVGRELPTGVWRWRIIVLGVLNIGAFFALLFVATYRIPGGVVATLGAAQPVVVLVGGWVLFGTQPRGLSLVLAAVGIAGVAMLVLSPGVDLDPVGVLAAVGAAVAMALGVLLTKRWGRPTSLLTFTGWQLTVGGVFVAALAVLTAPETPPMTVDAWIGFAWLAVLNTGLGYYLWFQGVERLAEAWKASVLGLLSPVVATAIGWGLLGQSLTPLQVIGAVTIVAGIGLSQIVEGTNSQRVASRARAHSIR